MKCEYCGKEQDGSFGSGRFCNRRCSTSFSSNSKREETNKKVSKTLKKKYKEGTIKHPSKGKKLSDEHRKKISVANRPSAEDLFVKGSNPYSESLKKYLVEERGYRCEECLLEEWNGKFITIELEHIDGDRENNVRENLRLLCPNCHSQTETFRGRNKRHTKQGMIGDEELLKALNEAPSIRQALIQVGLAPKGGNYYRCKRLLGKI